MATIRAHFDGKVIVPDEPVDLPVGEPLRITVDEVEVEPAQSKPGSIGETLLDFVKTQPPIDRGDLPTDGAKNYRHYLYGHPKQP